MHVVRAPGAPDSEQRQRAVMAAGGTCGAPDRRWVGHDQSGRSCWYGWFACRSGCVVSVALAGPRSGARALPGPWRSSECWSMMTPGSRPSPDVSWLARCGGRPVRTQADHEPAHDRGFGRRTSHDGAALVRSGDGLDQGRADQELPELELVAPRHEDAGGIVHGPKPAPRQRCDVRAGSLRRPRVRRAGRRRCCRYAPPRRARTTRWG
jgi:hypothetical protein